MHACVRIHQHILLQVLLQLARRDQGVRFGSSFFPLFIHLQALFQVAKATSISEFLKSCEVKNPRVVRVAGLRRGFFVPGGHAALRCATLCCAAFCCVRAPPARLPLLHALLPQLTHRAALADFWPILNCGCSHTCAARPAPTCRAGGQRCRLPALPPLEGERLPPGLLPAGGGC